MNEGAPSKDAFSLFERLSGAIPKDSTVGDVLDAIGLLTGLALAECPQGRLQAVSERLAHCASVSRRATRRKLGLPVDGETTVMPEGECRGCGKPLNAATALGEGPPEEGDASICIGCGMLSVWTGDGQLRVPSDAERNQMLMMPEVQAALRLVMERAGSGAG